MDGIYLTAIVKTDGSMFPMTGKWSCSILIPAQWWGRFPGRAFHGIAIARDLGPWLYQFAVTLFRVIIFDLKTLAITQ